MPGALAIARARRARRAQLAAAAHLAAARIWRKLNRGALTQSWDAGLGRDLLLIISAAQAQAAEGANAYIDGVLAAQGFDSDPEGTVVASALAGIASDGRSLASLLYQPIIATKTRLAQGMDLNAAMESGLRQLQLITVTQVIDAGRVADGIGTVTNRRSRGYVRVLTPPSCGRCAILAGVIYASERPFQRHPRCLEKSSDCIHLPVGDKAAGEAYKTSARDYFDSLNRAQQDRIFTNAGAQAIRDGADINQVVNARRGMSTAGSYVTQMPGPNLPGRNDLAITHRGRTTSGIFTTEGITRRGVASRAMRASGTNAVRRLMPEGIYQLASDRAEILSLLRRYGYIT